MRTEFIALAIAAGIAAVVGEPPKSKPCWSSAIVNVQAVEAREQVRLLKLLKRRNYKQLGIEEAKRLTPDASRGEFQFFYIAKVPVSGSFDPSDRPEGVMFRIDVNCQMVGYLSSARLSRSKEETMQVAIVASPIKIRYFKSEAVAIE